MHKFKLYIFIFIYMFITCMSVNCNDAEINWRKITDYAYVDFDGIIGVEDVYGYKFLLKAYNKGQYENINGENVSYTISSYTIDCEKHKYKIGTIDSYDKNDKFINGDYNRYAKFQPIVEGTAISKMSQKLCRL